MRGGVRAALRVAGQVLPVLAAGAATAAGATLGAAVQWQRGLAAGVVVAVLVALARRLPPRADTLDDDHDDGTAGPQSSGFHPSALLADSLARAAADPSAGRRVRPRLLALAEAGAAARGTTPAGLVADGTLSPGTAAWLGVPTGAAGARAADLDRVVAEVCALVEPPPDAATPTDGPPTARSTR